MVSADILDLNRLLEPISDDNPVGENLRSDPSPLSIYYQIKDVRSKARAAERQAVMAGDDEAVAADWRPILEVAPEALANVSKDLEVTAYLIEALVREHGFAGLRDGFRLAQQLVERYGDDIYPLPDEDGVETRVAPLTGLNGEGADGTLIAPIANIPLTDNTDVGQFARSDYVQAQDLETADEQIRERRISQGAVPMSTFQAAVAETSGEFFRNLLDDILACSEAFTQYTATVDEKYGRDAPPTSGIRRSLEECREVVESVARDKLAVVDAMEAEDVEESEEEGASPADRGSTKAKAAVGTIENREDAFREILRISQYFRKTEPHSPISYALEQIVRWGRLPLPDLLKELISDESSVSQMFKLVGIKSAEEPMEGQY